MAGRGAAARRPLLWTLLLLLALAAASLPVGVAEFRLGRLLDEPAMLELLLLSRLPRTLAALLTGASLAVAGALVQLMVRNRFVGPGTMGTTEAAVLGLLAATLLAPGLSLFAKMLLAALAALAGTGGFLLLIRRLPPEQPLLVPLVGLIYSGILAAAATFLAYQADLVQYLGIWTNGEFSGVLAGRYELLWLAGCGALLVYLAADQFTLVGLGRTVGVSLGLNYGQTLTLGLASVALVTALVVVTVGGVPFVGLVVPNLVARLMGDDLRRSLPVVAGAGAGLVLACDILGRLLRYPYEVPVGSLFGVVGAVAFLWLLLARPGHGG